MKNGQKMKLTKIAAVTLSAALIFGCDDLEFKESTSSTGETDSGSETDTGSETTDTGQYSILTNVEAGSSGQMRYDVAAVEGAELTEGQVDVNVFYSSSETETAYISLFNADTNTAGLVGEVQLDDGNIKIRSGDSTTVGTFTTGTWVNVNVTWSVTAGTYTVTVDGTEIGTYDFHNSTATGVDTVGFKIGNNALTDSEEFLVDDFTIYSDEAGTTEVFFDDYEDYVVDELLDGAGDPYNDETQPAIVGGEASDDTDDSDSTETDSTQVAAIADTDTSDTGELRYKLSDTLATGQVNVSILYDAEEDLSAYVTVFSDGGTSTSNQIADLKLDDGNISLRNIEGTLTTFTPGEWVDVQINWVTDGTGEADVTFSIDDTQIGDTYSITYDTDEEATFVGTGAEVVSVRYVDNSGTTVYTLYADDLSITDGTSEVFSDDFEGFDIDEVLDGTDDDYNNNSSEATVAAQPE
ncbi:hypothetical protein OW492_08850 [Psychromonas sp. 14N.309.X.WAT.B.A12]|uniref:hypothetical protein n=1 Tax=Psychromonas sp. 14N.309.X.WAT.B.A12 TaxID=2998322 RepID=UPI0025B2806C|nr:hypothetical protein [Psychromonas sp. 14N.309.X.WAT.B.A12]MDN2663484.1 hypothetical protein [Psychromonas sp. 14N.309.X.WAT.B.A12]